MLQAITSKIYPKMNASEYFASKDITLKKKYDALRAFFYEKQKAEDVARQYGYTLSSFYSLTRDFNKYLRNEPLEDYFFKQSVGRKKLNTKQTYNDVDAIILQLRGYHYSCEEIVVVLHAQGYDLSYGYVYEVLKKNGFERLARRSQLLKQSRKFPLKLTAPKSQKIALKAGEHFLSTSTGLLSFLPLMKHYKIDELISNSAYPETKVINKLASIFSFLALKLSNVKRYSQDDLWCMDRGLGLFAGLNVLPKASWLSSYSSRITKTMNRAFLQQMHQLWVEHDLLGDTANLDFTTIPYWGEQKEHLEKNWSGKRNKALDSMLALLVQHPDNGIIDYGTTDVTHQQQNAVVLEYLDFYKKNTSKENILKYLVFDSKFTNYENLSKLDEEGIKFITIRKRGQKMIAQSISNENWKTVQVEASGSRKRKIQVLEQEITLKGYQDKQGKAKSIKQVVIKGNGKIKPAFIIFNDFELSAKQVVRKYAQRWLVEKDIEQQIDFFHLNRLSSAMVIKVDFDLVMTILAHNLYRIYALQMERYDNCQSNKIYYKFIVNSGRIKIDEEQIIVELKKKRDLPQLLEVIQKFPAYQYPWLGGKKITFYPSASS